MRSEVVPTASRNSRCHTAEQDSERTTNYIGAIGSGRDKLCRCNQDRFTPGVEVRLRCIRGDATMSRNGVEAPRLLRVGATYR